MEILSSRVLLYPSDFERSRRFYSETLGLRIYREYGAGGDVTGVVYFLGGGFLELNSGGPEMPEDGSVLRLWLQVPCIDDTHEHLRAGGVQIDEGPDLKPWGLKEMWVRDPDGVRMVVVEVPPDHPLRRRVEI